MNIKIEQKILKFKRPAGTSRGVYTERKIWILRLEDERGNVGLGEIAPLPKLSCDYDFVAKRVPAELEKLVRQANFDGKNLLAFPSLRFAVESAMLQMRSRGSETLGFDTEFARGNAGICINGLIWMGDFATMRERIREKISVGFRCIKLKIGAINFDDELALLREIRREFSREQIELRVDANGAFSPSEAREKLRRLAELDLHSIEQPIRAGQSAELADLCAGTPLPIALDEELIGVNVPALKRRLLDEIRPQFLVLKPSLHGGFGGCEQWISLAEERGIGWWITSALESNIGLNALAQWTANLPQKFAFPRREPDFPQGLGTGMLFEENFPSGLEIRGERLWFSAGMSHEGHEGTKNARR